MSGDHQTSRAVIRNEAAFWFNERLAGDMTIAAEERFEAWLAASEANRDAYARVERAWAVAGTAAGDPALADARESRAVRARWWRRPALALAATLMLVLGIGSIWFLAPNERAEPRFVQAFETGTGQRSRITLPDGSVVTLDAESDMRFRDLPHERRVELTGGRAFFRVAHNAARPFIVHAGGKTVRAIGTAFEVRYERGDVAVTLAEGKVRVEDDAGEDGNSADMTPGRQLVIAANRDWTMSRVDVEKVTSWTQGRLVFMNDPLAKAVEQMNRYSTRKLRFADGRAPAMRIVGVFSAGDVDGFVKALELYGIVTRVSTSNGEIILTDDPQAAASAR